MIENYIQVLSWKRLVTIHCYASWPLTRLRGMVKRQHTIR